MIGGLGTTELIVILVIVLVLFGAGRLPEVGSALGRGIRNFKKATQGEEDMDVTPRENEARPSIPQGENRVGDPVGQASETRKNAD